MLPKLHNMIAQRGREYHVWIALCLALGVRKYVELGCATGSSASFAYEAGIEKVVTVDIALTRPPLLRTEVHFISADSSRSDVPGLASDWLNGSPDAVFVDASHTSEGIRKDFELWWPLTSMVLGFHDISGFGVASYWLGISRKIRSIEIISRDLFSEKEFYDNGDISWGGIGVLFKEEKE